ncbi:MAG: hypothetical protein D6729_10370 [Deltaproteobacteria bacterium]|nr:MAG: hypothetical protein D6729_10370 [Deltaproteobacteria bacterium]
MHRLHATGTALGLVTAVALGLSCGRQPLILVEGDGGPTDAAALSDGGRADAGAVFDGGVLDAGAPDAGPTRPLYGGHVRLACGPDDGLILQWVLDEAGTACGETPPGPWIRIDLYEYPSSAPWTLRWEPGDPRGEVYLCEGPAADRCKRPEAFVLTLTEYQFLGGAAGAGEVHVAGAPPRYFDFEVPFCTDLPPPCG